MERRSARRLRLDFERFIFVAPLHFLSDLRVLCSVRRLENTINLPLPFD
jgi:hypothetical protein